jgi:hypothetical protein
LSFFLIDIRVKDKCFHDILNAISFSGFKSYQEIDSFHQVITEELIYNAFQCLFINFKAFSFFKIAFNVVSEFHKGDVAFEIDLVQAENIPVNGLNG